MTKTELTIRVKSILDKKLAKIKSDTYKKYEEKLGLSTEFFDAVYIIS